MSCSKLFERGIAKMRPSVSLFWLFIALIGLTPGCNSSSGNGDPDAWDGSVSDGLDGVGDGTDAISDDGGTQTDQADGGNDAGNDADGNVADEDDPWAGCPTEADYLGDNWTAEILLEVTDEASYCFTFDSTIAAEDQMPVKNRIRIFPGTYGLPAQNGEFDLVLPACVHFGQPGEQLSLDGTGSVVQEINNDYFLMEICQPMQTGTGDPWALHMTLGGSLPNPGEKLVLDALALSGDGAWMALHRNDCEWSEFLRYQSCHYDWVEPQRHLVQFDGGEITLTLRLPQIDATVFGLFSQASGMLDGTAFDQQSYWKLAFYSWLHFFFCDFIVLFDDPIGQACGIKIDELLIWGGDLNPERKLELIDCDLNSIEERTILSAEQLP
jgi:hypothetical protein